ncbi:MAG: DUF4190 domain-containing protein [Clostridia bacterium]|nr:DUF4190 domain-containing protein [Clostridia bacterium]
MEEKDLTLEKAQELYNKGKYKECMDIAINLVLSGKNPNPKESGVLVVNSGLHLGASTIGDKHQELFEATLELLHFVFDDVKTSDEYIQTAKTLFEDFGRYYYVFKNNTGVESIMKLSFDIVNGKLDLDAVQFRRELDSAYLKRSRQLCERVDSLLSDPSQRFGEMLEAEGTETDAIRESVVRSALAIQQRTMQESLEKTFSSTLKQRFEKFLISLEKKSEMTIDEYTSCSVEFLSCMSEVEHNIIECGEEVLGGRLIYGKDNDYSKVSFASENETSTVSREFLVEIASAYLNSKTIVNGNEVNFCMDADMRADITEKIRSYTAEIRAVNPGYGVAQNSKQKKVNNSETTESAKEKTNIFSIIGFALSIFSLLLNLFGLVGAIGAIVSGVSLKKIKDSRENGKVFAYIGIIIGLYSVIYGVIQIINRF